MNIGKYEVLGELGHGAMGTVYRARDPRLDRLVAIKLIQSSVMDDPKRVALFEKEAHAIARLSHPNIVTIFEFDHSNHQPYIVMELLRGTDLTTTEGLDHLSIPQKLDLIRQVCDGLSHAHELGIIHRDIKPANIFLTTSGVVKITDFGIARLSSTTMTTGTVMGTPEYMAPERLATGKTDLRCDLFSTGVVLYWLLTGIRPFAAEDVNATFYRLLNYEPPSLSLEGIPSVQSQELNRIVQKALAKNPEERYSSAADMSRDLQNLQQRILNLAGSAAESETLNFGSGKAREITEFPKTVVKASTSVPTQAEKTFVPAAPEPVAHKRNRVIVLVTLVLLLAAAAFTTYRFLLKHEEALPNHAGIAAGEAPASTTAAVEIRVATGKEKIAWMEQYAKKFMTTSEGRNVRIVIVALGAQDTFRAMVEGREKIQAWAPASDMLENLFVTSYAKKFGKSPVAEEQRLMITPMVLLMWETRYREFTKKYGTVMFSTILKAMEEKDGWAAIANKPEWGQFKFGFSDPGRFNSGLALLLMMSHEYMRSPRALKDAQIPDKGLMKWMVTLRIHAVGMQKESRDLVEDMIAKGPSAYDMVFTYEHVALQSIKQAEGRWGDVRLIYPTYNFWMDNPYYVLDMQWCSEAQKEAAHNFMQYLYSPDVQKQLLKDCIRPGNPAVPLNDPSSPFLQFKADGIVIDIQNAMEEPSATVVKDLIDNFNAIQLPGSQERQSY